MQINDDELIYMIRKHDETAFSLLEKRYSVNIHRWVDTTIHNFRFIASFRDDAISLARISWMEAIETYREDEGVFYAYAKLCVDRELLSLIRTCASKQTRQVLFARSFDEVIPGSENLTLEDTLEGIYWNSNPVAVYSLQEMSEHYLNAVETLLSDDEYALWKARLDGHSYDDITRQMGLTQKQIDNALQRIKSKILSRLVE